MEKCVQHTEDAWKTIEPTGGTLIAQEWFLMFSQARSLGLRVWLREAKGPQRFCFLAPRCSLRVKDSSHGAVRLFRFRIS